jgi:hypothetical protein
MEAPKHGHATSRTHHHHHQHQRKDAGPTTKVESKMWGSPVPSTTCSKHLRALETISDGGGGLSSSTSGDPSASQAACARADVGKMLVVWCDGWAGLVREGLGAPWRILTMRNRIVLSIPPHRLTVLQTRVAALNHCPIRCSHVAIEAQA